MCVLPSSSRSLWRISREKYTKFPCIEFSSSFLWGWAKISLNSKYFDFILTKKFSLTNNFSQNMLFGI